MIMPNVLLCVNLAYLNYEVNFLWYSFNGLNWPGMVFLLNLQCQPWNILMRVVIYNSVVTLTTWFFNMALRQSMLIAGDVFCAVSSKMRTITRRNQNDVKSAERRRTLTIWSCMEPLWAMFGKRESILFAGMNWLQNRSFFLCDDCWLGDDDKFTR